MAKVTFSTQIEYETLVMLNEFIKKNPGLSKASVTNEALKEYIQTRTQQKHQQETDLKK
jgi:hypothetical protein